MADKNSYIIYLRVIATVFVVLIHASTGFLNHIDTNAFDWNYANWINAATRCSVPIFVAISGSLLLQKDENTLKFYKKRIPKLIYPFLFWTFVYLIYYFYRYTNFESLSLERILTITQDKILHGANAHLWYLYMIIGVYLTIPFLRKIITQSSIKEIELFLLFWLLAMFVSNKGLYTVMPKFDLTFFSGYVGYLVLGYYLTVKSFNKKRIIYILGYFLIIIIIGWGTYLLNQDGKKLNTFLYNYLFPTTALATTFLFLWIKAWKKDNNNTPKWIAIIDRYSFGIYLSHIIPLNFLHPLLSKYMGTAWGIPLATISTIIASVGITYLLRKIPFGRYVSG